jgi:hypothetical protein
MLITFLLTTAFIGMVASLRTNEPTDKVVFGFMAILAVGILLVMQFISR